MLLTLAVMLTTGRATGQVEELPTAGDAMGAAHADLAKQPAELRPYLRYLSLHNLEAKARAEAVPVLNGHCNGLSRSAVLEPARAVAGGMLLRVNLRDYRWDTETWEKLTDPYFTVVVETESGEHGYYKEEPGRKTWIRTKEPKKTKAIALAPWLSETPEAKRMLSEVVAWTGSKAPVVRADWFFNQTAAQVDRSPGYYDFLGIKDEATFQKLIGFDLKLHQGFRFELREAVGISGVTLQPRAIIRFDTLGGGYWKTLDFIKAIDKKNPLRVLGRDLDKEGADASEQYGHLANGLWATAAFDGKGKAQASVPGNIANDHASRSNDKQIHPNVSCMRCHAAGAGLQPIDGWVRNLLAPPLDLRSTDYDKAFELKQQYARSLEPFLARDRLIFEAAVKEATGLTAKVYAEKYAAAWERYEDAKIDAATAARDVGLPVAELKKRLLAYAKTTGNLDPILSALVLEGPRARAIPIRQYEEAYPALQSVIRGFVP